MDLKAFLLKVTIISFISGLPLEENSSKIVFPENDDTVIAFVPKCSNNRTFCEDVETYPESEFYTILRNTTYEEEYFRSQIMENEPISQRFHPENEHYICKARTRKLYPRVARNIKKEWKFVYNFGKYKQEVTTEECINKGSCIVFHGSPKDVKTRCVQKFSDRLLLVADKDGNPIWDLFLFPSACVCSYQPIINFNIV